ncbi:hypothetical protein TSAR_004500 [Trichomalopsis sarcophagae]|uniref:Uncharacterized protein n=1 Tax=Trichomalopsis sarcophagae TaxID=543379 RepID=A0A232EY86_9HYME|nr:hypothetical protein TSAR_004500 [Trichomalopsis sarcophagae]
MSDDQRTEDRLLGPTLCKTCTKGNPHKCDKFGWHYHARSTPTQPIFNNGKTIQVCRKCLLVSNLFPPCTVNSAPSSISSSPLLQPRGGGGNSSALTTWSSSPQSADTAILNKILEKLNKLYSIEKLQNTMKNEAEENGRLLGERIVASSQAKLSAELVITGLASTQATSLRLLAYAALKPLDAQLTERDITSARPLIKRRAVREDDAGSVSTAVAVTEMRPTPIALSADFLRDTRVTLPLSDSFINTNEYLPPDVHRLGVDIRAAVRGIDCSTFVRDGRIYIRAKNEARAVMIISEEDLKAMSWLKIKLMAAFMSKK